MGRVMAGDFLEGVGEYLYLVAPARDEELSATIRARAGELAEADKDMVVDKPSEGALGIGAAVLASFETLLPLFDGRIPSTRSTRHAGRRNRSTAPAGTSTSSDPGRTCSR
jgi:hypothetical protein